MKLFRWRRSATDQEIRDSTIGNVFYVRDITGDVSLGGGERRYRYWYQPFPVVQPPRPGVAAAQLPAVLDPAYQVVPLVGRDSELEGLRLWLEAPHPMAARLLHADSGHGKSRLVEHFRGQAERLGWVAQQAIHAIEAVDESATVELGQRQALLLVVDDAHRWPVADLETLAVNLRALRRKRPDLRIRLLLVARTPGLWWPVLADRLRTLAVAESTVALGPLSLRISRAESFDVAVRAFTDALYAPPPQVRRRNPAEYRATLDLDGPRFDSVLAVHTAALTTVHARANRVGLPTGPGAITAYLLDNEFAEWNRRYDSGQLHTRPELMQRLVYLAVLTRGLPRRAARRLLMTTRLAGDDQQADTLLDDHARCYPATDVALAPLKPDQLAEDFLALRTPGHPAPQPTHPADTWVTELPSHLASPNHTSEPWTTAVVTTLVETASRWPHLAATVLYPLLEHNPLIASDAGETTLLRLAQLPGVDPAVLTALHRHVVHTSDTRIAEALDTALLPHRIATTTDAAERASLYTRYADELARTSHYRQAYEANEQAVSLYRRLAESEPERYLPDLADGLLDLGTRLGSVGRLREAVSATEQAVGLYLGLVEAQPETYLPGLANGLNSLGNGLGSVGRLPEAVSATEAAVELWRGLSEAQHGAYLLDLAGCLDNLGIRLGLVGRLQEAVSAAEQAAELYRSLAEGNSEMYLLDVARCLDNLGNRLESVGRLQEAVHAAEEAVGLYRGLVDTQPEAHLPYLSRCLNNFGNRLGSVGRVQEAVSATEEAVGLWRGLSEAQPDAYLPNLANSLDNLGNRLGAVGRLQEAVHAAEEAVELHRGLVDTQPETHLPDLSRCLNNFGNRLGSVGRVQEAVSATEEAVGLWRELIEAQPQAYLPNLAGSLNNLGFLLASVERFREAVGPADESVELWRQLTEVEAEAHRAGLASALTNRARTAVASGDHLTAGLAAASEAIELYQALSTELPELYEQRLREARSCHSELLGLLSSPTASLETDIHD